MADETTFLDEAGVRVTNTRFITPKQTYALNGITSVRQEIVPPKNAGKLLGILLGVLLLAMGGAEIKVLGGFLLLTCGYAVVKAKVSHGVTVTTAAGESQALSSADEQHVARIVAAINNAIVFRG